MNRRKSIKALLGALIAAPFGAVAAKAVAAMPDQSEAELKRTIIANLEKLSERAITKISPEITAKLMNADATELITRAGLIRQEREYAKGITKQGDFYYTYKPGWAKPNWVAKIHP